MWNCWRKAISHSGVMLVCHVGTLGWSSGLSVQPCACSHFATWRMFPSPVMFGFFFKSADLERGVAPIEPGCETFSFPSLYRRSWRRWSLAGRSSTRCWSPPRPFWLSTPSRNQRRPWPTGKVLHSSDWVPAAGICHICGVNAGVHGVGKSGPQLMYQMLSHFGGSICVLANYSGSHYSDQYTSALIFLLYDV